MVEIIKIPHTYTDTEFSYGVIHLSTYAKGSFLREFCHIPICKARFILCCLWLRLSLLFCKTFDLIIFLFLNQILDM